ncbi:MAG: class I SAM-dependent methyltransferase [Rhodospirillales bacterium]|nr:class I SAM-dependent methyltransferase [Rhodospirillales bacterium]
MGAGCGGGLLYQQTNHAPRSAIGVERSHVAASRARRLGVDVRQGDAARLSMESASFDGVFCLDALGYLPATALTEAFRFLKPGGSLLGRESFRGIPEAAGKHFRRRAGAAGFEFTGCFDASAGVRRSLLQRSSAASFVLGLPAFIRDRLKETLFLDGSERLRLWQSGGMCFVIATFRRPNRGRGGAGLNHWKAMLCCLLFERLCSVRPSCNDPRLPLDKLTRRQN